MRSLFDDSPEFDRDRLAARLASLAQNQIFIGTSSWKYPGWVDQIYTATRYMTRGRFSKKRFEAECIREYAEVFPTVCGDFAFYQFPTSEFWANMFARVPKHFQFALKVPEQITRMRFPDMERYGSQAGQPNPCFLDAELFHSQLLDVLRPFQQNVNVLILEFGALPLEQARHPQSFLERLDVFLGSISSIFPLAVEVRNPEMLVASYFDCLRKHGVAHVYNGWSRMPDITDQIAIADSTTAHFTVCRALLRPGRSYEQAVKMFQPYSELREPYPLIRDGLRELIHRASLQKRPLYAYVNNRLEGNAPRTIEAVVF